MTLPMADAPEPLATSEGWTKGPWKVAEPVDGGVPAVYPDTGKMEFPIAVKPQFLREDIWLVYAHLIAAAPALYEAASDALSGWRYIRSQHGDLYGVGWDRVEQALTAALALARGEQS